MFLYYNKFNPYELGKVRSIEGAFMDKIEEILIVCVEIKKLLDKNSNE